MTVPRAKWTEPGCPTVEYSLAALDQVRRAAVEGLLELPRIGLGVGGFLLGSWHDDDRLIGIEDALAIPCAHLGGPGFELTREELVAARALSRDRLDLNVVGFYMSRTRGPISARAAEDELFRALCPDAWQIMLVIRPNAVRASRVSICFRDADGVLVQGIERDLPEWNGLEGPDAFPQDRREPDFAPAQVVPTRKMFAERLPPARRKPAESKDLQPPGDVPADPVAYEPERTLKTRVRFKEAPPPPRVRAAEANLSADEPSRGPRISFSEAQPKPSAPKAPSPALSDESTEAPTVPLKIVFSEELPPPTVSRVAESETRQLAHGPRHMFVDPLPLPAAPRVFADAAEDAVSDDQAADEYDPSAASGFSAINPVKLVPQAHRPSAFTQPVTGLEPILLLSGKRRKAILWGAAAAGLVVTALVTSSLWLPAQFKLELSDSSGHVTAVWNADAVDSKAAGTLTVVDAGNTKVIKLTSAQISAGVVGFDRESPKVTATLKIGKDVSIAEYSAPPAGPSISQGGDAAPGR